MKFSLRDLFLVTLVVALGVGWWVDRGKLAKEIKQLRDNARNDYGFFGQAKTGVIDWPPLPTSQTPAPNPPKP